MHQGKPRNPCFDPITGDVLKLDLGDFEFEQRTVTRVDRVQGGHVFYYVDGERTRERSTKMKHWREIMVDAEIEHTA